MTARAQKVSARGRLIDLAGRRFGGWRVIAYVGRGRWFCLCDCGVPRIVIGLSLRSGRSQSCGCLSRELTSRRSLINLTGRRFGRWKVLSLHPERYRWPEGSFALWLCRCDCGTERVVLGNSLRRGASKSCGCLAREKRTTHGLSKSRVYEVWHAMKQRCLDPRNHAYPDYGGRGIGCEVFLAFEDFFADRGHPPPGLSLDRINNDGNYEPGNCRRATPAQQVRNRRPPKRKRRRADIADIRAYAAALARARGGAP